ncbi:hypothetical protein GW17_00043541 [Ensete ventricosum]|nr:hypothetical protein GW17_00043541 [Ensete ventricosum]
MFQCKCVGTSSDLEKRLGARARRGEARAPRFYSRLRASKMHRQGARPSPSVGHFGRASS